MAENLERVQVVLGDPLDFSSIVDRSRILGTTTLLAIMVCKKLVRNVF